MDYTIYTHETNIPFESFQTIIDSLTKWGCGSKTWEAPIIRHNLSILQRQLSLPNKKSTNLIVHILFRFTQKIS